MSDPSPKIGSTTAAAERRSAGARRHVRVLHVVASMDRAGMETWLMNMMRRIDRTRYQFDFAVQVNREGDYDAEIRALGGRIIPCFWGRNVRRFRARFAEILSAESYDVVHAHPYNFAGVILRTANDLRVPKRIAHLHSSGDGRKSTPFRIIYRRLMRRMVRRHATTVVGCTAAALAAFLGRTSEDTPDRKVLYYGIDTEPFEREVDRSAQCQALTLPSDTLVMLHVGRFIEAKNHATLIDIYAEALRLEPKLRLVLVGDGPLLDRARRQAHVRNIASHVHFLGVRSDVPQLMRTAHVMVMPSTREGLPVTMIEATAAGLPLVISDMPGTREALAGGCRATLVSLKQPVRVWAETAVQQIRAGRPAFREALNHLHETPFTSEASCRALEKLYTGDS